MDLRQGALMHSLLRRARGLLGLGLFSGAVWAAVGFTLGLAVLIFDPADVGPGEGPLWIAFYFGRAGLVAGVMAGAVLALAERRASKDPLKLWRLSSWGAIGGFAIPWLAAGPQAMLPLFVVLGAATGTMTWALARRGERLQLREAQRPLVGGA
jgi:hypothetical protein